MDFFPITAAASALSIAFGFPFGGRNIGSFSFSFGRFLRDDFSFYFNHIFDGFRGSNINFFRHDEHFFEGIQYTRRLRRAFFAGRTDVSSAYLATSTIVAALSGTVELAKSVPITSHASALYELHTTEGEFSSDSPIVVDASSETVSFDFYTDDLIFNTSARGFSAAVEQS